MNILYVHGLSSSGNSHTVSSLRRHLPSDNVVSPDLPLDPSEALQVLHDCLNKSTIDLVIGTSMGGMFAQKLRGYMKILVNPAFHVSEFMRERIGIQKFLNPRQDGVMQFEITADLCDQYAELEAHQFDQVDEVERKNTYGLFGDSDDLINCRPEFLTHYAQSEVFSGGHRLNEEVISKNLLPLIESLRNH